MTPASASAIIIKPFFFGQEFTRISKVATTTVLFKRPSTEGDDRKTTNILWLLAEILYTIHVVF